MPYLLSETLNKTEMQTDRPLGPGPWPALIFERAVKMQVWASAFMDPGPDWCEYVLFDREGTELARRRVEGY